MVFSKISRPIEQRHGLSSHRMVRCDVMSPAFIKRRGKLFLEKIMWMPVILPCGDENRHRHCPCDPAGPSSAD